MPAAVDDRGNLHTRILATNIQRAHSLGPVHLVAGDGCQVDVLLDHVDRNLTDRLSRVGVEDHAAFVAELANLNYRLNYANLVVGVHDRHQDGLVVHCALQVIEIDQAVLLDGHIGDAVPILFEALAGVEHGLVLGNRGDNVVTLLAIHLRHTLDGEVIALGGAGSEDDLFCGRADQLGDTLARGLDAFFGSPSKGVIAAGSIAELLHEVGQHLFEDTRVHRCGGVVVHVDGQLHTFAIGAVRLRVGLGDLYIRAH